jgi:hypothetical protein
MLCKKLAKGQPGCPALRAKAGKGGISMARFFAYFFINEKSTSLPGLRAKETNNADSQS